MAFLSIVPRVGPEAVSEGVSGYVSKYVTNL